MGNSIKERFEAVIARIEKGPTAFDELCEYLEQADTIVGFGAGAGAGALPEALAERGLGMDFLCDNDAQKVGKIICGLPVISPAQLLEKYNEENTAIVILSLHFADILKQLEKLGITERVYIRPYTSVLAKIEIVEEKSLPEIRRLFELLGDEESREVLVTRLERAISVCPADYYAKIRHPQEQTYLDACYTFKAGTGIIDCGAFTGDTLENFINKEVPFGRYYAFEFDPVNYRKLYEYVQTLGDSRIIPVEKGVSDKRAEFSVSVNAAGSSLYSGYMSENKVNVTVDRLDEMIPGTEEIGLLKMDIEGAEYEALRGAQELIKRNRPVLAVSAYHNFCDLWRLPQFIEAFGLNYKFYLRHYTKRDDDTVLYAL